MPSSDYFSENDLNDAGWRKALRAEFKKDYLISLDRFCEAKTNSSAAIYPPRDKIFAAFNLTPLDAAKVVILGQDPYHGEGQAMGLSFSVPAGARIPPSLRNIYKEINSDIGELKFDKGDLTGWARQGVLLLNSVLTVTAGQAGSHRNQGWERFTDKSISAVSQNSDNTSFLLWGSRAIGKRGLIDESRHLILEAPHPSPLSAYRGFLGCKHFSKTNNYLRKHGRSSIDW